MKSRILHKLLSSVIVLSLVAASPVQAAELGDSVSVDIVPVNQVDDTLPNDYQEPGSVSMPEIPESEKGYIPFEWDNIVDMTDEDVSLKVAKEKVVDEGRSRTTPYNNVRETVPAKFPASVGNDSALETYLEGKYPGNRNQNPFGTCWAHGSAALGEFYQINKGEKDKSIDYSELYLALGMYKTLENPTVGNSNAVGGVNLTNSQSSDKDILDFGGNYRHAGQFLTKGFGFLDEADLNYIYDEDSPRFDSNGNLNYNLNELKSKTISHVTDVYEVNIKTENGSKVVKEAIMQNGIVGISYYDSDTYYNENTNSFYNYTNNSSNHAVTIVGWDDNYPVTNFNSSNRPQSPGAWLVRNSWGYSFLDFFSRYKYFWMSYEDLSLRPAAYIFDMADWAEDYDNNYYYDTQIHGSTPFTYYTTVANVFNSKDNGDEILNQILLEVGNDTNYTIKIYTSLTDASDPESGTLSSTITGSLSFPGIYTIPVYDNVVIEDGSSFSVVVTTTGKSVAFETVQNSTDYSVSCGLKSGQSFIKYNGSWNDFYTFREQITSQSNLWGNACISARTINTSTLGSRDFYFTPPVSPVYNGSPYPVEIGTTKDVGTITIYYKESGTSSDWTTSAPVDAGNYLVKIDVSGKGEIPAQRDISSVSWHFTIAKANQSDISISGDTEKTYGDGSFTVTATGGQGDGAMVYGTTTSSIFSVNKNTGVVSIIGAGEGYITAYRSAGKNYNASNTARLKVTVGKAQQGEVTITDPGGKSLYSSGFRLYANGGNGTGSYIYSSGNESVLTFDSSGYATIVGAGSALVTVYRKGDTNYYDSAPATITIEIHKMSQSMVYISGSSYVTYGGAAGSVTASGGSGTGGFVFSSSDESILVVNEDGSLVPKSAGSAVVSVYREEDSRYTRSNTATRTITVYKGSQDAVSLSGDTEKNYGDEDFYVVPSGGKGTGGYVFSSTNTGVLDVDSDGKVTIKKAGTAYIRAYKAADGCYNQSNTASLLIRVNKIEQTTPVTISAPVEKRYGEGSFTVTASGGNGTGSYVFASSNSNVLSITSAGVATIKSPGTVIITAYRASDDNYLGSAQAEHSITINKGSQNAVTINDPGEKTYGNGSFWLSATGGNGSGAITYRSSDPDILEIAGSKATIHKAGTVTVYAKRAGNDYYNDSAEGEREINIAKAHLVLKAANASIKVGSAVPELSYRFTGLVNGDTELTSPVLATDADGSVTGEFPIYFTDTGSVTNQSCYELETENGVLSVNNLESQDSEIYISGADNKEYGDGPFYLSFYGGNGNGDYVASSKTPDILNVTGDGYATILKSGYAEVSVYKEGDGYYNRSPEYTAGFYISERELVFRADDLTIHQGESLPEFTYSVSGLAYSDSVTENPEFTCDASGDSAPGDYDIGISGAGVENSDCYSITYVPGRLRIYDPDLSDQYNAVYMDDVGYKEYGDDPFYVSFYGGDGDGGYVFASEMPDILSIDPDGLTTILKSGYAEVSVYKEGDYSYNPSPTYYYGIYISNKALTFTAEDKTVHQGDDMPELTYSVSGLVNSDQITEEPVLYCDALDTSASGYFNINIYGGSVDNMDSYDISYVYGSLIVEDSGYSGGGIYPQYDEITMDDVGEKHYGDDPFYLSFSGGNGNGAYVVTSETPDIISVEADGYVTILRPGWADVSVYKEGDGYYDASGVFYMGFYIAGGNIVFRADDKTISMGENMPELTYTIEGLVGSDKVISEPSINCYVYDTSITGDYNIEIYGGDVENWGYYDSVSYEDGVLHILDPNNPDNGDSEENGNNGGNGQSENGNAGGNEGDSSATESENVSIDTEYKKSAEIKTLMLKRFEKTDSKAVVKKTKFKSSNKKVVKVNNKGKVKGGKQTGTATITMYVKTEELITMPNGKQKRKLSKWTLAGELTVNNTGK